MSVNSDKVNQILNKLEEGISRVRYLLSCPEGIRLVAIWREDFSYVEYWDADMPPRIILSSEKKVEEEIVHQYLFDAVGSLPPSICGTNKTIELYTDIETFSEGINASVNIFQIEVKEVEEELIEQIRERHDFNDYMSRVREAQRCSEQSPGTCGDQ